MVMWAATATSMIFIMHMKGEAMLETQLNEIHDAREMETQLPLAGRCSGRHRWVAAW